MALSHNPSLVTEGLIIYLDANNTSSYAGTGTTWYDLSGNSRHASLISSPSYEGFGTGKYLSFDGSTNYATIPYTITDNLITVGFWYYSKVFSSNSFLDALISNYTSGISGFDVRLNSSTTINLAIVIAAAESQISIGTITNNTWYFIAFTYDGATVRTYLDGVFRSSANVVGTRANGTQICVGTSAYDTNRRATCGIPQVMIYNRALSDSEILQIYNATKKRYLPEENIVRNGLIINIDAGNTNSYAGTGLTAFNLIDNATCGFSTSISYTNINRGGFVFDGTFKYILMPTLDSNTDLTVNFWNRRLAFGSIHNLLHGVNQSNYFQVRYDSSNLVQLVKSNAANMGSFTGFSSTSSNDVYLTVRFTKSSNTYDLFINGAYISSITNAQTFATSGPILGSGYPGSEHFNGYIYSFTYYNRVLSSTEILQNYNALKTRYGLS